MIVVEPYRFKIRKLRGIMRFNGRGVTVRWLGGMPDGKYLANLTTSQRTKFWADYTKHHDEFCRRVSDEVGSVAMEG